MLKDSKKSLAVLLFVLTSLVSGCGFFGISPIELAGTIAKNKTDSRMAYDNYVMQARKDNTERELHQLTPIKVETYREWLKSRQ